jgi:hypothetical protein
MTPEYERVILLGDVISRCPFHKGFVISPKFAALQTINPRRFAKHGTTQVIDEVQDCPFEEDVLHDFLAAF